MINPSELKLDTLPWLPLEARSAFPRQPAIYFAIDSEGTVQYVGRSVDPKRRWVQHHHYEELAALDGIRIAYLFTDADLLPIVEAALIEFFDPPLNIWRPSASSDKESNGESPEEPKKPQKVALFGSQGMIQWRLRQLMAEINLVNNDLAELAGIHRVTISKLKNADMIKQISGDVLNSLCNGLTIAYQEKGFDRIVTPGDLMLFTPDPFPDKALDNE